MKVGKTITFVDLFDEVERIEIPIIQRDYAQGRAEAFEVRNQFLEAIKTTLLTPYDEIYQPLDLDFIYGNFEGKDGDVFSVLDGQQRLTTLFLLHWYLAIREEQYEAFRAVFTVENRSRFTYKTRPSTTEFFDALVDTDFTRDQLDSSDDLSDALQNGQWFFLSWWQDPTVQSCLCMIDAIHHLFNDIEDELYPKLTNKQAPIITFQYLNLKSFDLSDELYIKMNSRGKPLTNFENFKAWLFGKINGYSLADRFELKVDQQWTDVFWQMGLRKDYQFDQLYLKFFNLMAFYRSCERFGPNYFQLDQSERVWLSSIRIAKDYISLSKFEKYEVFTLGEVEKIESILDYIDACEDDSKTDLFESVLVSSDYVTQARFYALIAFIKRAPNISDWDDETLKHLGCWSRVTGNLVNNFRIDELAPFLASLRSIDELSLHCFDLYNFLSNYENSVSGFTKDQWEEERIKACLILSDSQWEAALTEYEQHSYLLGKVGFLLDMANEDDAYSIDLFKLFAEKACTLLSDNILRSGEFLLQRALLSYGNYLISIGSSRYSFGMHNRGTYRERSENWFSVVGKPEFVKLIHEIDGSVENSLRSIISSVGCGDWREIIVKNPFTIGYCGNRLIHKSGDEINLLTKSTLRGYHAELRTYVLHQRLREFYNGQPLPCGIEGYRYVEVYGWDSPGIKFRFDDGRTVRLGHGAEKFKVFEALPSSDEYPEILVECLIDTPQELRDILLAVLDESEIA